MGTQGTVKSKLFLAVLAIVAVGLLAAGRGREDEEHVIVIPPPAGPPAKRGIDAMPTPRECDPLRGNHGKCKLG